MIVDQSNNASQTPALQGRLLKTAPTIVKFGQITNSMQKHCLADWLLVLYLNSFAQRIKCCVVQLGLQIPRTKCLTALCAASSDYMPCCILCSLACARSTHVIHLLLHHPLQSPHQPGVHSRLGLPANNRNKISRDGMRFASRCMRVSSDSANGGDGDGVDSNGLGGGEGERGSGRGEEGSAGGEGLVAGVGEGLVAGGGEET
eukprot:1143266-Pelagomonas_calceolata.AAC.1